MCRDLSLFVPDLCTELILKYRNYNINEDTGIAFIHILFILSKKQLSSASLLSPKSASTRDTLLTPKHPGKSDSSMQRSSSPWSFAPCGYFSFTAIQRWAKCTSNVSPRLSALKRLFVTTRPHPVRSWIQTRTCFTFLVQHQFRFKKKSHDVTDMTSSAFQLGFLFFEAMWRSLSSYYCAFSAWPVSLIMSCHTAETLIN